MKDPITVIIPAFRAKARIGKALASVIGADGVSCVIVVIDDQCEDTAKIARAAGASVLINDRNCGPAVSRNRGLAEVTTPYVFFLDSDDWVEAPLLRGLSTTCDKGSLDLCFGPYVTLIEETGERITRPKLPVERDAIFRGWLTKYSYIPPCAVLWRTASLRKFGSWNENIRRQDDAELVLRSILLNAKYGFSDDGMGIYLSHVSPDRVSQQSSRINDALEMLRGFLAIPEPSLSVGLIKDVVGEAAYEIARVAYLEQQFVAGREALRFARFLGFSQHRGTPVVRAVSRLAGLEGRIRLQSLAKRLSGRRLFAQPQI